MLVRNAGHFVSLSSCAGLFGVPNLVPYCGTKFAVLGFMQALSEELLFKNPQNNIKFTTIYPHMVDTGLCKRPRSASPPFNLIKPTAASIIRAQRTSLEHASVPRAWLYVEKVGRFLPHNAMRLIDSFLGISIDSFTYK